MGEVIAALFGSVFGLLVLGYALTVYREIKLLPDGTEKMRKFRLSIEERWLF
jgi:hypothetical protein